MDKQCSIIISETVFAQEVDGEMVLLDMQTEEYFGLDNVGTEIWQLIEVCSGDLSCVLEKMVTLYDVPEERIQKDIEVFIKSLEKNGLIKVVTD